jgi:serine/threonine-protein phosphatase 2A regulatory subunit A
MGSSYASENDEMLNAFVALAEDNQDSVRLYAIDCCVELTGLLPRALSKEHVLPRTLALASDTSWRVRWSVANKFVALCGAVGSDEPGDVLLHAHERLLEDNEMEVRTVAAATVAEMARKLTPARARSRLLPLVSKLVSDDNEHVRTSIASVIMALGAVLGADMAADMIPLYLKLLQDTQSDVRLNVIAKLGDGGKGVDLALSHSLQPAINELARDDQWRVRLAVIELMPSLAERLGVEFFTEDLRNLCFVFVRDPVYAVRVAAMKNIASLIAQFGMQWANEHVIERLLEMVDAGHTPRMTFCKGAQVLAPVLMQCGGASVYIKRILPALKLLSTNEVPNVRFAVANAMQAIVEHSSGSDAAAEVEGIVRPVLRTFLNDDDVDVTFFANAGLLSLTRK